MTLSPKVFGVTTKPTDPTPAVGQQTFFAPECVTPVTYPWLNEFIQKFLNARTYLGIENIPNDENALKNMFEKTIELLNSSQNQKNSCLEVNPDPDFKYWPLANAIACRARVEKCNARGDSDRQRMMRSDDGGLTWGTSVVFYENDTGAYDYSLLAGLMSTGDKICLRYGQLKK